MNNIYFRLMAVFWVLSSTLWGRQNLECASSIDCRVFLKRDAINKYMIYVSIKNTGLSNLVLLEDYLPWRSSLLTTLAAIPLDPLAPQIPFLPKIVDPTMNEVIVKPGEQLSGKIILSHYFDDFYKKTHRKEFGIFWSFVLQDTDFNRYGRYTGFFILNTSEDGV